jgi:predicted AlkP superfamily phosphohydrolase/phosphomutase
MRCYVMGRTKLGFPGYAVVFFIIVCCTAFYMSSDTFNLKCVVSQVDGNKYCVRDSAKIAESADLLAEACARMKKLVAYMHKTYPDRENVQRLVSNFNPDKVMETLPTSEFTAYSEDKGKKLAFCLRKHKKEMALIDINTLSFVAIHELGHLMTESIGHKSEFWNNFKFLLENAVTIHVYDPVDYKKQEEEYCGMTIDDSPLYDM